MNHCEKCEEKNNGKKGFFSGILYGLLPHTFCIAFILFSILGVTAATTLLRPLLLNPYFFYILLGLSFIFAVMAAIVYLKKTGNLSSLGIKKKWKYLSILFGTTISVNLILFMVIFPLTANINSSSSPKESASLGTIINNENPLSVITLKVDIPCPGHAPLITTELKKINGVEKITFKFPNEFDVLYNANKTSKENILALNIFNTYKATVVK